MPNRIEDEMFVDSGGYGGGTYIPATPETLGDYPTLRAAAESDDLGLTHTIAISDVTDLQNMNNNKSGNYYLTGDIDASATSGWNGGLGFAPISTFTGTLDGFGYTVSNLFINRPTTDGVGLLNLGTGADVANITLSDVDITGKNRVGALIGNAYGNAGMNVHNCHSSGIVKLSGNISSTQTAGGLIGSFLTDVSGLVCAITDCSSSCTVDADTLLSGSALPDNVGGFIGYSLSKKITIHNCFATGNVSSNSGAGGFGGVIYWNTISDCHATGNVTADIDAAGFILHLRSCITDRCYSTGNVTGGSGGGGFAQIIYTTATGSYTTTDCYSWGNVSIGSYDELVAGFAEQIAGTVGNTILTNCYCIGTVTGGNSDKIGGFSAEHTGNVTVTSCYWDTEASGVSSSHENGATGKTTTEMKTQSTYVGWDFDTIWYMVAYAPATEESWVEPEENYGHLEGETVAILADGVVMPRQVVVDGQIDDTDFADAEVLHVGLAYRSKLMPMKPVIFNPYTFTAASIVVCKEMGISFHDSAYVKYGTSDDNLYDINFDDPRWTNRRVVAGLFSGTVAVSIDGGFTLKNSLIISTDEPLPAIIRCLIPRMDITSR